VQTFEFYSIFWRMPLARSLLFEGAHTVTQELKMENSIRIQFPGHVRPVLVHSPTMKDVFKRARRVASTGHPVLITGPSGVGKELVARYIHQASSRSQAQFVSVNAATLNPNLAESMVFGHEPGAFTGATRRQIGKLEAAGSGTFFMDEIATLSTDVQAKLLRVLQEKEFERMGSHTTLSLRARIIAAGNANFQEMIRSGAFRLDLYHRLAVVTLQIPALKDRPEDLRALINRFFEQRRHMNIDRQALKALASWPWPGNVRELENVLHRLEIFYEKGVSESDVVAVLEESAQQNTAPTQDDPEQDRAITSSLDETMAQIERQIIRNAIMDARGRKIKAARMLGITRARLYRRIEKLGMQQAI
jgi:DNA-binding NtrC family response regulator